MTRVSIDVPDELHAKMRARAAAMGHGSLEEYLESLVRADADPADYGAPQHLRVRSREHLESLLKEALDSPAREMTAADWDEKRRALIERHRKSQGR